jgi:acyl-CoA thioester hydrolase
MPRIFIKPLTVTQDVIDVQRHVNNLAYLRWMQDVAIEHSAARGWSMDRYVASGTGWVARSHYIEYLRPAFLGEELSLLTWVQDVKQRSSRRHYLFWRSADQEIVARAETVWVFVDLRAGKPVPIPDDLRTAFELVPEKEDVLATTGLRAAAS